MTALLAALCVWGLFALFLGHYGVARLMADNNACEMTYSSPRLRAVPVSSAVRGFSLFEQWEETEGAGGAQRAVLFVPGHGGSAAQMRSLASTMHSKGRFRFFGLDFNGSRSAVHGGYVLAQAVYLNDALKAIQSLDPMRHDDIIVVGHSMGGIVIRAAMVLDNHPPCTVSNIILLSSPSMRPSFSIDSSLVDIFVNVNRAWKHSFYNETPNCVIASSERSVEMDAPVEADWKCPRCTARARVISITGGDVDYFVPAPLTSLRGMEPSPLNRSTPDLKPIPLGRALKPKGGFVAYLFRGVKNAVLAAYRAVAGQAPSENGAVSCDNNTCSTEAEEGKGAEGGSIDPFENSSFSMRTRQLLGVTQEAWDFDMLPHVEPQHFTFRTNMLQGVGFQVDHLAILWCRQVMTNVHRIMEVLSDIPLSSVGEDAALHRLQLPLKYANNGRGAVVDDPSVWIDVAEDSGAAVHSLKGIIKRKYLTLDTNQLVIAESNNSTGDFSSYKVIPPVASIMRRNAIQVLWKQAGKDERHDMAEFFDIGVSKKIDKKNDVSFFGTVLQKLQLGWLVVSAIIFVAHRLQTVCITYTLLCCLVFISPVLERLSRTTKSKLNRNTAFQSTSVLQNWCISATPSVHLSADFWCRVFAATLGDRLLSLSCALFSGGYPFGKLSFLSLKSRLMLNVSTAAFFFGGLAYKFNFASRLNVDLIQIFGPILEWTASYGIALCVWLCVGFILLTLRTSFKILFIVPLKRVLDIFSGSKAPQNIDVDAIRKARVAAAAEGPRRASLWEYAVGIDLSNVNVNTIKRPHPVQLVLLMLSPLIGAAFVFCFSILSSSTLRISVIMKILCAANVSCFVTLSILWFVSVLIPSASFRAPQWCRGSTTDDEIVSATPASSEYTLMLACAITLPIFVLACPSFEFSLAVLFEDITLFQILSSVLEKLGLTSLSEIVKLEHTRFLDLHLNLSAISDIVGIFGPGMLYVATTLYLATLFLVFIRSEPILDQIRPVAWLCEIQESGNLSIRKVQKEYAFSVKKTKTKNQSHGSKRTSSTSIFDDVVSEIISTEQGQMGDSSSGKCFHEDGGKFAIFGKTDEYAVDVSRARNGSVFLGSVFHVVSCRCFEDKSLTKGRIEWCDWCRCYDCGGRINKTHTTDEDGGGSWISRYITVPDTNADLALLIGLFGSLVWTVMYVNDYLFRVLHCLGCICAVFCAHRMVTFLGY